jgi:hypothetical protein
MSACDVLGGHVCGGMPLSLMAYIRHRDCARDGGSPNTTASGLTDNTFARHEILVQSIIRSLNHHHALLLVRAGRHYRRRCGVGTCSDCHCPRLRLRDHGQWKDLPRIQPRTLYRSTWAEAILTRHTELVLFARQPGCGHCRLAGLEPRQRFCRA